MSVQISTPAAGSATQPLPAAGAVVRHPDWPKRLSAYFRAQAEVPFAWGSNDCALFTCGGVQASTGTDLAAGFRSQYTTALSAARAMREFTGDPGATPLVEALAVKVAAQFNLTELATVKLAQRGDVVLFDTDDGPALGIVALDGVTFRSVGPKGMVKGFVLLARRAWRIAHVAPHVSATGSGHVPAVGHAPAAGSSAAALPNSPKAPAPPKAAH